MFRDIYLCNIGSNIYSIYFKSFLCSSRLKNIYGKEWFKSLFLGPSEQTLDDFIRMIVEQQISVIVMLSFTYDPITCTYAVS